MGRKFTLPLIPLALVAFFLVLFAWKNWVPQIITSGAYALQPNEIEKLDVRPVSKKEMNLILHLSPDGVKRLNTWQKTHDGSSVRVAFDDLSLGDIQSTTHVSSDPLELTVPNKTAMSLRLKLGR